jgi:hypothetical protein
MPLTDTPTRIIDSRHPSFFAGVHEWEKWRLTYRGGEEFLYRYLEYFSTRETGPDFQARRALTPIPGFAKTAINEIRNSIFQRMADVVRRGGSEAYQNAIAGLNGGVDRRGATMNSFIGKNLLEELLVMGRCGVFVDMPIVEGPTLADAQGKRPYLYTYQIEDILSWAATKPEDPNEFQSLLLRDTCISYDHRTMLPLNTLQRYRMLWIDQMTGLVNLQFYDLDGKEIDRDGNPGGGPIELQLTRIPFVMVDIGDSLIKDVCQHQIALLNLGSSDVNYALKSNFPFYTEQRDKRAVGHHLKHAANEDGTATSGGQGASEREMKVGVSQGRYYDMEAERPGFIHPSPEPLRASITLQEKLENDIRKLVMLAVVNIGTRTSAESKQMDNQGLEAGLSFIGLVLEAAERRIADYWSAYEDRVENRRNVATIKYPDRYSLKSDKDRIEEADELSDLIHSVPSRTAKKEIQKVVVTKLLSGHVKVDTLQTIYTEIDEAKFTTSDPDVIINAKEAGLVGEAVASQALGFPEGEHLVAREDHVSRIKRIAETQAAVNDSGDPAARGVDDLSADPANAGKEEKAASRSTDLKDTTKKPVRGKGK